jgi:hypothetical protein
MSVDHSAEPPGGAAQAPEPPPSGGKVIAGLLGSATLATALALFSAIAAIPAFIKSGVSEDAITHDTSGTQILSEPYIDAEVVRKKYKNRVPRAVVIAYEDFNRGTRVDLDNDTQDYQTRYSPDATCAEAKAQVIAVYGQDACTAGSQFYKLSTQYERALLVWNGRGDPATSYDIALNADELRHATAVLRAAEAKIVACVVKSQDARPINVTVSPNSGFRVYGEKTFTLDPGRERRVLIAPEKGIAAAIGEPGCTLEYDLAAQAKNARASRMWIALAAAFALGSFLLGAVARRKGWKKES